MVILKLKKKIINLISFCNFSKILKLSYLLTDINQKPYLHQNFQSFSKEIYKELCYIDKVKKMPSTKKLLLAYKF